MENREKTVGLFKFNLAMIAVIVFGMLIIFFPVTAGTVYASTQGDTEVTKTSSEPTVNPTDPAEPPQPVYKGWSTDKKYYYNDNGEKVKGFNLIDNCLYYFHQTTGEKQINIYKVYKSKLYKFGEAGVGEKYTGTYKSILYKDGSKYTGAKSGGYYYSNGKKVKGFKVINKHLYYFHKTTGKKQTNIYKVYKSKLYKFGQSGAGNKYTGKYKTKLYKRGSAFTGVKSGYYYYKGTKKIYRNQVKRVASKKVYYFTSKGKVYSGSGWKRIKGNKYYFKKGLATTGWKYVGGYKYYFTSKGKQCQDLISHLGKSWMKKNLMIKVNRQRNCVTIYAKDGKKGYTVPVKAIVCSVGKSNTPTVKGNFKINRARTYRWKILGGPSMGGYVYGQYSSRITGSYLFHSVTYRRPNNKTLVTSAYNNLGKAASHGCIRLKTKDAKLIYDIARYRTTKVVIYDSSKASPFDKPSAKRIPWGQNYDPTDPNV